MANRGEGFEREVWVQGGRTRLHYPLCARCEPNPGRCLSVLDLWLACYTQEEIAEAVNAVAGAVGAEAREKILEGVEVLESQGHRGKIPLKAVEMAQDPGVKASGKRGTTLVPEW